MQPFEKDVPTEKFAECKARWRTLRELGRREDEAGRRGERHWQSRTANAESQISSGQNQLIS